jgi:hypothetical protein
VRRFYLLRKNYPFAFHERLPPADAGGSDGCAGGGISGLTGSCSGTPSPLSPNVSASESLASVRAGVSSYIMSPRLPGPLTSNLAELGLVVTAASWLSMS